MNKDDYSATHSDMSLKWSFQEMVETSVKAVWAKIKRSHVYH